MEDERDGYSQEDAGFESYEIGRQCTCEGAEFDPNPCPIDG